MIGSAILMFDASSLKDNARVYVYKLHDDYVIVGLDKDKPRRHKLYITNDGYYFKYWGKKFYIQKFKQCKEKNIEK